ncbi:MAG TPA: hypothetical protein VIL85_22870 [Thermomicrobiales bacterium]|jgi:hypothetical protein
MQLYTIGGVPHGAQGSTMRDTLKGLALSAFISLVLSLSAGIIVVGVLFAASGVAVAGAGVAYGSCQQVESNLAAALDLDVATLRATDPATLTARLTERQAHGLLTAREATRAEGWATTYADCRLVLGRATADGSNR